MKCSSCDIVNCYRCTNGPFAGRRLKRDPVTTISFTEDIEEIQRVTISSPIGGMQVKVQATIRQGELQFAAGGEYILKPMPPGTYRFREDVPFNEHVTMLIASQVFKLNTAKNGVVIIDDKPCYITKRFDVTDNGDRIGIESFAQLMQCSEITHGKGFRYESTFEELGRVIDEHFLGPKPQKFEMIRRVLFNYLIGNGDAHLGNFSGQIALEGTYIHTPVYDVLNTSLHTPDEAITAMPLFEENESDFFLANGFYGRECFELLGRLYGLEQKTVTRAIDLMLDETKIQSAIEIVSGSGLGDGAKDAYINKLNERFEILNR